MAAPTNEGEPPVALFSTLGLLQIIKSAQSAHGLRHGDYMRYRQYCARKVRRVRKSLKLTHTHKAQARRDAKFIVRKVTPEVCTHVEYLIIPLFDAERCWAHAMDLKQQVADNPAHARRRFHMVARLNKAVRHAQCLENICKTLEQVDSATKLEAQAYAAWMRGVLAFERKQWSDAIEHYTTARTIYTRLADIVADQGGKDLYLGRIDEMQPALRYCAYETGDTSAVDDLLEMRRLHVSGGDPLQAELDKLLAATRDTQASKEKMRVQWCGHSVSVEEPFQVYQFHDQLSNFEQVLESAHSVDEKLAAYENLLILCRDAIQSVREWAKGENLKAKRITGGNSDLVPVSDPVKDLVKVWDCPLVDESDAMMVDPDDQGKSYSKAQLLYSYLCSVRADMTYRRYMLQISQAKNPGEGKRPAKDVDLIRLYDAAIQTLTEQSCLPGMESSANHLKLLNTTAGRLRARRCVHVAHAYASMDKLDHALMVYDRAIERIDQALMEDGQGQGELSTEALQSLRELALKAKYQVLGRRLVQRHAGDFEQKLSDKKDGESEKVQNRPPILSKPDEYPTFLGTVPAESTPVGKLPPLVTCPPAFRPMPAKPLFFDLALNHVQFPDLQAQITAPAGAEAGQKQAKIKSGAKKAPGAAPGAENGAQSEAAGISGMVKGWFWGGSK